MPVYILRVVKGPDRRKQKRIASARAVIGASAGADLELSDPTVSALHCAITTHENGFRVTDLGSKNGTVLGKRSVIDAWLEPEDELQIGESVVRFELQTEHDEIPLSKKVSLGGLKGSSAAMRSVYELLEKAMVSDAPVLLLGETGTGKELAAEALASLGPRAAGPFEVVDCARLSSGTAESELFGHEKGAFTGAVDASIGAFERAKGGTVFLDEVGELSPELQPKLLGVLDRKVIHRLGGKEAIPIDVRIISATHRELEREVNRGAFRADLFFRLSFLQIRLPALRDRREDIPELVAHFAKDLPGKLSADVLERLCSSDYPGNVRQLRAAVERASFGLAPNLSELSPVASQFVNLDTPFQVQKERLVRSFEYAFVKQLLSVSGDNLAKAARRAGISRVHLYNLMRRLGL